MATAHEAIIPIYNAAVDPNQWQPALDAVMRSVGADSATMLMVDLEEKSPWVINMASGIMQRIAAEKKEVFADQFAAYEANIFSAIRVHPAAAILTDSDLFPDVHALRNRPDYRYLINELGLFRRMGGRLNDNRSWFDAIAFQFAANRLEIPAASISRATELMPHFAKAFDVSRGFRQLLHLYEAVLGALDHVQVGVCVVLNDAAIVVSNREAKRILGLGDGIVSNRSRKLELRDPAAQSDLNKAIAQTALTANGKYDDSGQTLLINRPSGHHPFLLDVVPLRDALAEIDKHFTGAMITLIDPDNPRPLKIDRVTLAYSLSEAEAEVCRGLVDGWSNQRIADTRNVSIDTVKTQVKSIMHKTGTHRRADLIRLVVQTSPPISMTNPP